MNTQAENILKDLESDYGIEFDDIPDVPFCHEECPCWEEFQSKAEAIAKAQAMGL